MNWATLTPAIVGILGAAAAYLRAEAAHTRINKIQAGKHSDKVL